MEEIKIEIDIENKKLGKVTMPDGLDVLEGSKLFMEMALMSLQQIQVKKKSEVEGVSNKIITPNRLQGV